MAFIRTIKQDNPFSQIDRFVFESDDSISWQAKGLMGYLLTRPDDWKINHKDLVNRATNGKDSVTSILKELEKAGYIHYYQTKKENGKFGSWVYDVYERPEFNPSYNNVSPHTEKPHTEKPHTEKPNTENADYNNNKGINNKLTNNKTTDNNKILDLRPIDDIENLNLPFPLKKWFGSKVDLLVKSKIDLYELEEFYTMCEYIKHDKERHIDYLNMIEFTALVKKLVENVVIEKSTQGVLLQWVHNKLHYKKSDVVIENDIEELDFLNNSIADKILNRGVTNESY